MNNLLETLLKNRNINTPEDREHFLNPSYEEGIHDPFLLPDMHKAADRILKAIRDKEKIVIYSDYDADGIPGAVVFHDFFKKIGYKHFSNYIPHRHDEGFGLNIDAVENFIQDGAKVLVTVDCGITDVSEIARLAEAGIDVIVTDHHVPHDGLPAAYAIVNPKLSGSEYPFDSLCGAGIAFKVVEALISKGGFDIKEGWQKWLLDMVGLATLSDMVPLVGENRVLAYYGLKVLRKSPRPGLAKLFSKIRVKQEHLSEDDIAFMIAPRVNAASRMGHPLDAFNMLAEIDQAKASAHAEYLIGLNDERKRLTASISASLRAKMSHREVREVIVEGHVDWKPGVLGLVANTVAQEYGRPVFLWGRESGTLIKGSVRTGNATNIVDLMTKILPMFVDYGGHAASGGFSISHEKVDLLDDALNDAYQSLPEISFVASKDMFEAEINPDEISLDTLKTIEKLAPFGVGNPKPLFLFKNLPVRSIKAFGKAKEHLEIMVEGRFKPVQAVAFFKKREDFKTLSDQRTHIDIVGNLERSYWNGNPFRLRIVDVR